MSKTYVTKRAEKLRIPIIELRTPLRVNVLSGDVQRARLRSSKSCALAQACQRKPGVVKAYVFKTKAYLEYRDMMVRCDLPPAVRREITSFDRAGIFTPGEYKLTAVKDSATLRAKREAQNSVNRRKKARPKGAAKATAASKRDPAPRSRFTRGLREPVR